MKATLARAAMWCGGLLALGVAQPGLGAATLVRQVQDVTFDVETSHGAQATLATCTQIVHLLTERGWEVGAVRVRIQANPLDATTPAADVVLGADAPTEDSAFNLVAALVARQIGRTASAPVAGMLAEAVAAHLSPPGSARRVRWELAWQQRLSRGDVLTTALPELLWRTGSDAAVRRSARSDWPASAFDALAALGVEDPVRALGELAVAGLLDPTVLGFNAPRVPDFAPAITRPDPEVWFDGAGMRIVALQDEAGAVAVQPLESDRADAWVAVRYTLTGAFDVVPLSARSEVTVPLNGTVWAGVIVVGADADAHLSLAVRPVPDYPVRVKRWDFLASDQTVSLSWETQQQVGLRAFVVEALANGGSGSWKVVRRTILPVADQDENSYGYTFVDEAHEGVAAYRLLALTTDGFLAELGTFPVRESPGSP
jgi:hypothetical protein